MNKEARIGLFVLAAILIFFAGFYFLKGSSLLSGDLTYRVMYENVQGLKPSDAVRIQGLKVGKVTAINLNRAGRGEKLEVVFVVSKKTRLPKGTVARLASFDLLGAKGIVLEPGSSSEDLENNALLPGSQETGLVDKLNDEVSPLFKDVRQAVNSVDSVLTSVNKIFSPQARTDLQSSLSALHKSLDNFVSLSAKLNSQSEMLSRVIQNADKISGTLARNSDNIDKTIANFRSTSENLSKMPLEETVKKAEEVAQNLNDILLKIKSSDGSLGLLVNDKELYNNMNKTLEELSKLTADIKAHPYRYINVTIFGRKAKVGQ